MRILVVEDEKRIADFLCRGLQGAGYAVDAAPTGAAALECLHSTDYDLVILDLMLPDMDGLQVLAKIRNRKVGPPVLILSARGALDDRVKGLEQGADDYLVKPFAFVELLARVRALLRRFQRHGKAAEKLKLGEVEIDLARQTAVRGKKQVHLTAKEFSMLRLMAEAEGEPVTRERFLDVVWGYAAFPTTRTVDNHIASLRAKLEPVPDEPCWLKTVHGVGYKLETERK